MQHALKQIAKNIGAVEILLAAILNVTITEALTFAQQPVISFHHAEQFLN